MRHFKIHTKLVVAAFAASAAIASSSSADVFRGVQANPATGVVLWTPEDNNFFTNGNPPALSFYDSQQRVIQNAGNGQQPDCYIRVAIGNPVQPVNAPPQQALNVGNPVNVMLQFIHNGQPIQYQANFPWQIENDNNPVGHWNILRAEILAGILPGHLNPSNNLGRKAATAGFQYLAQNDPQVTVINGALNNCAAQ